jgi:REP element-mobilizing transposase RayT
MKHFAGEYYHVYNRGCNRENIFASERNYLYLLRQAEKFLERADIRVIAYCLMPNHYHFLIRSDSDNGIAIFIQRLFNSYTQAFNRQHKRSGTLFEGRAKSILVDDEGYLLELSRYIHLNPVVAGLVKRPEDWLYSNCLEWMGKRSSKLFDQEFSHTYFPNTSDYAEFITSSIPDARARKLAKYLMGEEG